LFLVVKEVQLGQMAITEITPEQFDAFVQTDGESVKCPKTRERLADLLGHLPNYRRRKNRIYAPIYMVESEAEFHEALARAKRDGYNPEQPLEATPESITRGSGSRRLSPEEQEKATNFALQTLLGTSILAGQGLPEFEIEARLIKQLCGYARAYRRGIIDEVRFGDEYDISRRAMDRLYDNARAPFIYSEPSSTWIYCPSNTSGNRVKEYANSFNEGFRMVNSRTAIFQTERLAHCLDMCVYVQKSRPSDPKVDKLYALCKERVKGLLLENPLSHCFI